MTHSTQDCALCREPIANTDGDTRMMSEPVHERCYVASRSGSIVGRVLVVDDDPEVGATVRDALNDFGCIVRIVSAGREAFALIPSFEPDVVVLDVMMPGMSGDEVLDRLHADSPGLPVVMVTAIADAERARALIYRGAFDLIRKPFDLAVLERVVDAALVSRRL
jgi:CheY-like chemotaxis protein